MLGLLAPLAIKAAKFIGIHALPHIPIINRIPGSLGAGVPERRRDQQFIRGPKHPGKPDDNWLLPRRRPVQSQVPPRNDAVH